MAAAMLSAPARVALPPGDDGWAAACLAIAGRVPVLVGPGERVQRVLATLGLPPAATGPSDARLGDDLRLSGAPGGRPLGAPLPPVAGPLVSILVCTYNRAHLLPQALASAHAQSWPHEVVVVDDGSTDGTRALLDADPRVRVVHQSNTGKPGALERGLAEIRGDAVLVLDDDDLLLPGALHVLATALFADPARVAVWADSVVFDGVTLRPDAYRPCCRLPTHMVRRAVLQQIPAAPGACLVRTAAQRAVGAYEPGLMRGEDMDLWLRLTALGPIEAVPLPTFLYRSHDAPRGPAGVQWRKSDRVDDHARFVQYASPTFLKRWREASPVADRGEGFAWALGLHQRDLFEAARQEIARWPPPFSPSEAWARGQLGLEARATLGPGTLVVVDDGDEGALEDTLARHADGQDAVWVDLEVPRDPLSNARLYWEGTWAARVRLRSWVQRPLPWRLRLTSAPEWAPPVLLDASLLPDLGAPEALVAVAAVLGWPEPSRTRPGGAVREPVASLAWAARRLLAEGRAQEAMAPLSRLLAVAQGWAGAWLLAAEAFDGMNLVGEADSCRRRAEGCRPVSGGGR